MDLLEPTLAAEVDPQPRTVTLQLWPDTAELLDELTQRTGLDASELVGWALGAYWREMEGIPLEPTPETTADEEVGLGLADIEAGRTYSHEEVFSELRAKFGR